MKTLLAKAFAILIYFLVFCNVGIWARLRKHKPWNLEFAFVAALLFSALFGILTIPHHQYMLGFVAFSVLYGVYSICYTAERERFLGMSRVRTESDSIHA